MARPKKEKKEKYFEAPQVEEAVNKILKTYPERFPFNFNDIQILFKDAKYKESDHNKKQVFIKMIKEPYSLLTSKKFFLIVNEGFYKDVIDSDKNKALIEGLLGVEIDDSGNLKKRKFDIETYKELVSENRLDFSNFDKILPGEIKLVLKG